MGDIIIYIPFLGLARFAMLKHCYFCELTAADQKSLIDDTRNFYTLFPLLPFLEMFSRSTILENLDSHLKQPLHFHQRSIHSLNSQSSAFNSSPHSQSLLEINAIYTSLMLTGAGKWRKGTNCGFASDWWRQQLCR